MPKFCFPRYPDPSTSSPVNRQMQRIMQTQSLSSSSSSSPANGNGNGGTTLSKRKISFDEHHVYFHGHDTSEDVTSRFLTSQYSSSTDTTTNLVKLSMSTSRVDCPKRTVTKRHISSITSRKRDLSRLSRSACLLSLDSATGTLGTMPMPSVSEDDMSLRLRSPNDCSQMSMSMELHMNISNHETSLLAPSRSRSSSSSSSRSSPQEDCNSSNNCNATGWGHFVDLVPTDLEQQHHNHKLEQHNQQTALSSFNRHSLRGSRYAPYSKDKPTGTGTFTSAASKTKNNSVSTDDISAAMCSISLTSLAQQQSPACI